MIVVSILCVPACAAAKVDTAAIQCPAKYSVYSASVADAADAPRGWRAVVSGEFRLRAAGVMQGPPEKLGIMVPQVREFKGGMEHTYSSLDSVPPERWAWCGYGSANDIVLYRPLPNRVKTCKLMFKHDSTRKTDQLESFVCAT